MLLTLRQSTSRIAKMDVKTSYTSISPQDAQEPPQQPHIVKHDSFFKQLYTQHILGQDQVRVRWLKYVYPGKSAWSYY